MGQALSSSLFGAHPSGPQALEHASENQTSAAAMPEVLLAPSVAQTSLVGEPAPSAQVSESAPLNPVAEVQAKLRAALNEQTQPSGFSTFVFRLLTTMAAATGAVSGLLIGAICVLAGFTVYLFPVTAGLILASCVTGAAYLGYRRWDAKRTPTVKQEESVDLPSLFRPRAKPNDPLPGLEAAAQSKPSCAISDIQTAIAPAPNIAAVTGPAAQAPPILGGFGLDASA